MNAIQLLADPSASHWIKSALATALARDPVDAANDAALLLELLEHRVSDLFAAHGIDLGARATA